MKEAQEEAAKKKMTSRQRRDANVIILNLADKMCKGRIAGIVQSVVRHVDRRETQPYVLEVLIERLEGQRKRHALNQDEIIDLENAKRFLAEFNKRI